MFLILQIYCKLFFYHLNISTDFCLMDIFKIKNSICNDAREKISPSNSILVNCCYDGNDWDKHSTNCFCRARCNFRARCKGFCRTPKKSIAGIPRGAYTKFVEKKPDYIQGVFWGMFDYMQGKVDSARAAMKVVLDNGGSLKEARDAYFEHASAKRVQLLQAVEDLNIQHGFADKSVQDTFDKNGKLPRSDA